MLYKGPVTTLGVAQNGFLAAQCGSVSSRLKRNDARLKKQLRNR
jgi:hypothetical protein